MAMTQIPNDISAIPKFKVVVVGDGGVGKSALTIQVRIIVFPIV